MLMGNIESNNSLLQWLRGTVVNCVLQGYDELTIRQLAIVLITYLDEDLQTVRGLAATLNISRPAVSRALDRLGDFGLIRRQMDPRDRRSVLVRRTRAGTDRIQDLHNLMQQAAQGAALLRVAAAGAPARRAGALGDAVD